ncbi:DUF481 domain-containing protein [Plesiocystis pacifica]|uniref:DUF481 domain-containing protein n=1 Tax=Plesiocystis pacifica TaxID=191768 RepID=UPI000A305643|nr:DUF481 domain-containing protein [Plesiocystis pacifica]
MRPPLPPRPTRLRLAPALSSSALGPAALLLGALAAPSQAAAGPVDTNKGGAPPREGLSVNASASVNLSGGNVNRSQLALAGNLHWQDFHAPSPSAGPDHPARVLGPQLPWPRQQFQLEGSSALMTNEGFRVRNSAFAFGRWRRMWHRRVGTTAFGQIEYDERRSLRRRSLLGAGGSVTLSNRLRLRAFTSASYIVEFERNTITVPDDPHPEAPINHRLSAVLVVTASLVGDDALRLRSATFVQPRFDDPSDLRTLQSMQLEGQILRNFAMGLDASLEWDNQPPMGVVPFDWAVSSYVRVSLGG